MERVYPVLFLTALAWQSVACVAELGEAEGDEPWVQSSHWAFQVPTGSPPAVNPTPESHPIDALVVPRLAARGLTLSSRAEPGKLLRRVTLGLTGLPPTLDEISAFEVDPSDAAYAQVVDKLLASPRYAEHMTAGWLDLARYSDTDGFQYDNARPAWPWRDWVLKAFDTNQPFDKFTIEQLAGDLLPGATEEQVLATGFNRNHAIQGENGLLMDEFRDRYVSDRVKTLGRTWLGLTLDCAKCHDHKFEPITANDYFGLYDCFNQTDEKDNGPSSSFSPTLQVRSPLTDPLATGFSASLQELEARGASDAEKKELQHLEAELGTVGPSRVVTDTVKRTTKRLELGQYDKPVGAALHCKAPHFLRPFPKDAPKNRLGLAHWLVSPDNPLTARVTVNRYWAHHFGTGLVPSLDNFGTQVAEPEHKQLLDTLATWFVGQGWDLKALHRLIVTSRTYQQSSMALESDRVADSENRWLARGPSFRLPAEVIRDLPLAVSGLLKHRLGGPPVYPYQPAGLWEEMSWEYSYWTYPVWVGEGIYRRSLYTYWKRTIPPPLMTLFDAPDREESTAQRERSITPLQALALLNGEQFNEAARHLAAHLLSVSSNDPSLALTTGFRTLTARTPNPEELSVLLELYTSQLAHFETDSTATQSLLSTGRSQSHPADPALAAMTQAVRAMFNLSETLTLE